MAKFSVILLAAGRSERFGDKNYKKPFVMVGDRAVWLHAAEAFVNRSDVCQTIVVVAKEDREMFELKFGANLAFSGFEVCTGGQERSDSVAAALAMVHPEAGFVAVHDAARPCVDPQAVDRVFAAAIATGAAVLASPVSATLKREAPGVIPSIAETVDRKGLWEAHTPQVFERKLLEEAYAQRGSQSVTDDAQLVERLGKPVALVEDSALNIKITRRQDAKLAELILKSAPRKKPEGFSHPFAGDDLWK